MRKRTKGRPYTTGELARAVNADTTTIARWVDTGMVEGFRTLGGHRRITEESAHRIMRRFGVQPD